MRSIVQIGDPVLRQQARSLSVDEILSEPIQKLIQEMHEIRRAAPGVGLAAPQIGLSIQLVVIEDSEELQQKYFKKEDLLERERVPVSQHVVINPKLSIIDEGKREFFEGCLSFHGFLGITPRAAKVKIECLDEHAKPKMIEASGWYARILQHEYDHLQGVVCIDRMYTRSLCSSEHYKNFWQNKTIQEIKEILNV